MTPNTKTSAVPDKPRAEQRPLLGRWGPMVSAKKFGLSMTMTYQLPHQATYEHWLLTKIVELMFETDPDARRCKKDLAYRRALQARRRFERKCRDCERPAESAVYCADHRVDHARRMRRWRFSA